MNIYSKLDFLKKWKRNFKKEIKEIQNQTSSFGILKSKKSGKIEGKQKKYLGQTQ